MTLPGPVLGHLALRAFTRYGFLLGLLLQLPIFYGAVALFFRLKERLRRGERSA